MKKIWLIAFTLVSISLPNAAQTIYKVIAADGTITYSDQPLAGSERVQLGKLNTAEPLATPTATNQSQASAQTQYTVRILSPSNEATIRNNLGDVTISASIQPKATGIYQLSLDGTQIATSSSGVFKLDDIQRGAHQIQISFADNTGKILASSEQQTFYMHKASALINSN